MRCNAIDTGEGLRDENRMEPKLTEMAIDTLYILMHRLLYTGLLNLYILSRISQWQCFPPLLHLYL
jgi:hypothetical protein